MTESEDPLEEPRTGAGMDVDLVGDNTEAVSAQPAAIPSYVVELAKSGRAVCRRCDEKIDNKTIRVGVILDGDYGLYTRWQHLHCTVFHKTITSADPLDGFRELSAADKEAVTQRVIDSQNEVDEDDIPLDPSEMVRKNWEKPLEPSSDLLMPLLPYQKEGRVL